MKKFILIVFYLFLFYRPALALVEVDITRGNLDPLPIAISPLYVEPGSKDIKQNDNRLFKNNNDCFLTTNNSSGNIHNTTVAN